MCLCQITPESGIYGPSTIGMDLAVRTDRATEAMIPEFRDLLRQASPELANATFSTMDQVVEDSFGSQRLAAHLLEVFGGSALLIGVGGLYGLLACVVTQRTRELGLRVALGAPGICFGWCCGRREGCCSRVVVGLASLGFGRLVGVPVWRKAHDAWTLAGAAMVLFLSGMLAAYLPARRAAGESDGGAAGGVRQPDQATVPSCTTEARHLKSGIKLTALPIYHQLCEGWMSTGWIGAKWWFWTGWAKTRRKDFPGALSSFERVLHLFPDNVRALCWAAHCLSSLKRYEEALPFLDRALQNRPDYASAHAQLGRLLLCLGRKQESMEALTRAFRIAPQLKKRSYISKLICDGAGRSRGKQEAIAAFKEAAQLDPNNSDAQAGVGWGLFDAKNFTEALEPLRKAVTLAPDYDYAYDLLAQSLRSLHRDEESLPIWERLVNLRPTDADAHAGLGWALQSVGRNREALAALKKAHELDSTLLLDYSFALSYAHLNEYREAIAAADRELSRRRMPISFVSLPTVSSGSRSMDRQFPRA